MPANDLHNRFQPRIVKQSIAEASDGHSKNSAGTILLRSNYLLVKIEAAEIVYVEALDDYIRIHFDSMPTAIYRFTLKSMMKLLPADEFVRVHRSYIVALAKITAVKRKAAYIDETEIPIGVRYENGFFKSFLGQQTG